MTHMTARETTPQPRMRIATRLALAAAVVGVMLTGVVLLGRLASSAVMAMVLTAAFFVVLAVLVVVGVRRRRELWVPVGAAYLLVAAGAGVALGLPLLVDDVVDEPVVVAATSAREASTGQFEAREHPGQGTATLVDTTHGTALTLTDFATDNGPDLRVYLVPADAGEGSIDGFVDLGVLKGNIGDQQYEVPDAVDAGAGWRVVVWCRAFAVTFTEALLV